MAVEKKAVAISIWTICAVLLVVVIVLAVFWRCCYRKGRGFARRYLHRRGAGVASAAKNPYAGYRRGTGVEIESVPVSGAYPAPQIVQLRHRANSVLVQSDASGVPQPVPPASPCDILVNVQYIGPSSSEAALAYSTKITHVELGGVVSLMSNEAYYSDPSFLLYTSMLQFVTPGTYVIDAYAVCPTEKTVSAVHEFVYVVIPAVGGTNGEVNRANAGGLPSYGGRYNDLSIHLNRSGNVGNAAASASALPLAASATYPSPVLPAVNASAELGDVRASSSLRLSQAMSERRRPRPPRIVPDHGEVTTATPILIMPHEDSTTVDQLRYSVDGTRPSVLYTGPFTLSLPPPALLPSQHLTITIKAIALSLGQSSAAATTLMESANMNNNNNINNVSTSEANEQWNWCSEVVEAVLRVRSAGYSYFDPALPAPAMRLHAVDARLYFDESHNPPGTRTAYQLVYVNDARRSVKFSRRRAILYDRVPIPLEDNVALVYAWTVQEQQFLERTGAAAATPHHLAASVWGLGNEEMNATARAGGGGRPGGSTPASYNETGGSANNNNNNADEEDMAMMTGGLLRSGAAIYDCARGSVQQTAPHSRRVAAAAALNTLEGHPPLSFLPTPIPCVSCKDMELEFDDPPANCLIAYTLNDTEPALYDVAPPACAASLSRPHSSSAARRRHGSRRSDDEAAAVRGDAGGMHTYRYQPGSRIHVTLLETQGVYVTARIFGPVSRDSNGLTYGEGGMLEQSTEASKSGGGSGGVLLGYRYGDVFRRGFFFHGDDA